MEETLRQAWARSQSICRTRCTECPSW